MRRHETMTNMANVASNTSASNHHQPVESINQSGMQAQTTATTTTTTTARVASSQINADSGVNSRPNSWLNLENVVFDQNIIEEALRYLGTEEELNQEEEQDDVEMDESEPKNFHEL